MPDDIKFDEYGEFNDGFLRLIACLLYNIANGNLSTKDGTNKSIIQKNPPMTREFGQFFISKLHGNKGCLEVRGVVEWRRGVVGCGRGWILSSFIV
jgi:hypothetical protein